MTEIKFAKRIEKYYSIIGYIFHFQLVYFKSIIIEVYYRCNLASSYVNALFFKTIISYHLLFSMSI